MRLSFAASLLLLLLLPRASRGSGGGTPPCAPADVHVPPGVRLVALPAPNMLPFELFALARTSVRPQDVAVVVVECARDRLAVAFSDMPMTYGCARTTVADVMARVDALVPERAFAVKLEHLLRALPAWRAARTCAPPRDAYVLLALAGAALTLGAFARLAPPCFR